MQRTRYRDLRCIANSVVIASAAGLSVLPFEQVALALAHRDAVDGHEMQAMLVVLCH